MPELDLARVTSELRGQRLRGPLLYRPRTGSTNDDALALAASGAVEGTVVIAGEQTHGRGRHQRPWFGHPDNSLLFSVVLRPTLPAAEFSRLVTVAGLAVAEGCVEACGGEISMKWPNDIMAAGRKVGGLLLEARAPDYAVLGIGLNVLGEVSDLPAEVRDTAASLAAVATLFLTREAVLAHVLNSLDRQYVTLLHEADTA